MPVEMFHCGGPYLADNGKKTKQKKKNVTVVLSKRLPLVSWWNVSSTS